METIALPHLTSTQPYQRDRAQPPLVRASLTKIEKCCISENEVTRRPEVGWSAWLGFTVIPAGAFSRIRLTLPHFLTRPDQLLALLVYRGRLRQARLFRRRADHTACTDREIRHDGIYECGH